MPMFSVSVPDAVSFRHGVGDGAPLKLMKMVFPAIE